MKRAVLCVLVLLGARAAAAQDAGAVLAAAERAMGIVGLSSIQFSGSGASYFVGQAPAPGNGVW